MNEYKHTHRRSPGRIGLVLAVLVLAGCSGMKSISLPSLSLSAAPLELDLSAQPTANRGVEGKQPATIRIANYVDARATPNSEKIGDISAAVNDMLGAELRLRNVAGTVETAMENRLRADGYRIVASQTAGADFVLSGAVKEFSLDIAGRDYVAIVVETTLRDARGGVVWSGLVSEKADRFAGVTGNSRASIARYLGASLAKVTVKTRDAIDAAVKQARPDPYARAAPLLASAPGVTVLAAPPEPTLPANGRLTLVTTPARARAYVADVYYGLTPLSLELQPGIHTLTLKLDGFKAMTEKVSVRRGETTELETGFER